MDLIDEKIAQAVTILEELDIDIWLTYVRESDTIHDPCLDFILGGSCTWQSAFMITRSGRRIAVVGSLDKAGIESTGRFSEVIGYVESIREPLLEVLRREDPAQIAINYSESSPLADGLTHGMYLQLCGHLAGGPFAQRLVTAEGIISALRGRKTPVELERIRSAVDLTISLFDEVSGFMKPGRTEKEIASFLTAAVERDGVEPAWDPSHCPAVFTGPDSAGAHAGPTDRPVETGHVLNIDFGVRLDDYCSDLQRTWYFLWPGEEEPPEPVVRAFTTVVEAVQIAADGLRPGAECWAVDDLARSHIIGRGYADFPHALGHQIGRFAHDGSGVLCPRWERYGTLPYMKVEEDQVYTLEPRITIEGHGVATVEEIVVVTKDGCTFLSPPQREIICIPASL